MDENLPKAIYAIINLLQRWVVTTSNLSAHIVRAKGYGVDDNFFIYDELLERWVVVV